MKSQSTNTTRQLSRREFLMLVPALAVGSLNGIGKRLLVWPPIGSTICTPQTLKIKAYGANPI